MALPTRGKSRRVVRLVSLSGDPDLSIELQAGVNKVGRQRVGNHIVLMSGDVSRFHAELEVGEEAISLRDLESANGTFVNDERIKERKLEAGDKIGFSSQFSFRLLIDMVLEPQEGTSLSGGSGLAPAASGAAAAPTAESRNRSFKEATSTPLAPTGSGRNAASLTAPQGGPRPPHRGQLSPPVSSSGEPPSAAKSPMEAELSALSTGSPAKDLPPPEDEAAMRTS